METGSWRNVMDAQAYASFNAAPGGPLKLGIRPALMVVDVVTAFLGEESLPLGESISTWPLSCGPTGWAALSRIEALIRASRSAGISVIYTTGNPGVLGGATKTLVDTRDDAIDSAFVVLVISCLRGTRSERPCSKADALIGFRRAGKRPAGEADQCRC